LTTDEARDSFPHQQRYDSEEQVKAGDGSGIVPLLSGTVNRDGAVPKLQSGHRCKLAECLAHRPPSAVRIGTNALDFFHHTTVRSKILFEFIRFVDAAVIGNTT
jgi:hypothetical protein